MSSAVPAFGAAKLTAAVKHNLPIFEVYQAKMTSVSNDLRTLEGFLKSMGVPIPFSMQVPDPGSDNSQDESNSNVVHYLSWNEDSDGDDFRLLYQVCEDSTGEQVFSRPLSALKTKLRLALHPHLPKFISDFAVALKQNSNTSSITCAFESMEPSFSEDDIPF